MLRRLMPFAVLASACLSHAQSPVQQYSGHWTSNWYTYGAVVTSDALNNAFVGGNYRPGVSLIEDGFVAKMSPSSLQQWFTPLAYGVKTVVNDVIQDPVTGNIYVSGTKGTGAIGTVSEGILVKLNSNGVVQWTRAVPLGRDGSLGKLDLTNIGNIVVGGALQTTSGFLHKHAFIRQYDPSGNVQWTQEYFNPGFTVDYSGGWVKVLTDGTILVVGTGFDDDLLWLRLNSGGAVIDSLEYAPPTYSSFGGTPSVDMASGDVYVGGAAGNGIGNPTDAFAVKIDINGAVVNSYTIASTLPGYSASFTDCKFSAGKVYLCGSVPYDDDDTNGIVVALNNDMSLYWNHAFFNIISDPFVEPLYAEASRLDALGNRVAVMGREDSSAVSDRLITAAFTASGTLLGERRQDKASPYLSDLHLLGSGAFLAAGAYSPAGHWEPTFWKFFDGVKSFVHTTTVVGGTNFNLRVNLSDPSFGSTVYLSDNSAAVTLPASVVVPTGNSAVILSVPTSAVAVNTPVTINAFVFDGTANGTTKSTTITVVPVPSLGTLSITPTTAYSFGTINATVSLAFRNGPAPTVITLSDNSGLLTTPATATIPAGGSFANFSVAVGSVPTTALKQITATLGATSRTKTVTIKPGLSLVELPPAVTGGSVTAANVYLTGNAIGAGQTVTLQASGPELNNPTTMVIPAGANVGRVKFSTDPVGVNVNRTLSAVLGGVIRSATISIETGPALSTLAAPTTIAGGTSGTGTVTLTSVGAPSRYVAVAGNSPLIVPDLVLVTATGTSNFTISTSPVVSNTVRNLSASMGGVTRTRTITVTP